MNELLSRIMNLSVVDPVTGCWLWCGAVIYNKNGVRYGAMKYQGRWMLAHRASWRAVHGREMPKRKQGAHSCDNTLCVCPDHIRGATASANQREAYRKGRKILSGAAA